MTSGGARPSKGTHKGGEGGGQRGPGSGRRAGKPDKGAAGPQKTSGAGRDEKETPGGKGRALLVPEGGGWSTGHGWMAAADAAGPAAVPTLSEAGKSNQWSTPGAEGARAPESRPTNKSAGTTDGKAADGASDGGGSPRQKGGKSAKAKAGKRPKGFKGTVRSPAAAPTLCARSGPAPMPAPTAPTTCDDRKWRYLPEIEECTNAEIMDDQPMGTYYNTLGECCDAELPNHDEDGACLDSYYDVCVPVDPPPEDGNRTCAEVHSVWYYVPAFASLVDTCTNMHIPGTEFEEYDGPAQCCEEHAPSNSSSCRKLDVCHPDALLPEQTFSRASEMGGGDAVDTEARSPSTSGDGVTQDAFSTEAKHTASNDVSVLTYTQKVRTNCVEHRNQIWNVRKERMVNVCVYACTETTDIYEGDALWQTSVKKELPEDCPEGNGQGNSERVTVLPWTKVLELEWHD